MTRAVRLWNFARTPLGAILLATLLLRLAGLSWGLPATDGWDNDGVAPRDFLVGALLTYWPGHHATYPPLHLLLLALVTAPVWVAKIASAPSFAPAALTAHFLTVPTMTTLAVVARAVSVVMSLGVVWNAAKIGEDIGGSRRAGAWVGAAVAANSILGYYAQTSNLDVPYLFWSLVALRLLVRAIVNEEPRALRRALLFAALAVAAKDQAYAIFALAIPATIVAWLALASFPRGNFPAIVRELFIGGVVALAVLVVADGAATNPVGFRDRVLELVGPASRAHTEYAATWAGRVSLIEDGVGSFGAFYPLAFGPLVVVGLFSSARAKSAGVAYGAGRRAAALVPLFVIVSFTLAFDFPARRSEHRFVLPQMIMAGIYAGLALDVVHERARAAARGTRAAFVALVVLLFGRAAYGAVAVDAAMLFDPRYDAEKWLKEHATESDVVEAYGKNVYLPRFSPRWSGPAHFTRVDASPVASRSPLPGVVELDTSEALPPDCRPRFLVVPEAWVWRYVRPLRADGAGREPSPSERDAKSDESATAFFRALYDGKLGYRVAHVASWDHPLLPRLDVHASLAADVTIFERVDETSP